MTAETDSLRRMVPLSLKNGKTNMVVDLATLTVVLDERLDVLAAMRNQVLDLIAQHPCSCEMAEGGLMKCRRCILLGK